MLHKALLFVCCRTFQTEQLMSVSGRNTLLCSKAERHLSPQRSVGSTEGSADCFCFEEIHEMCQISGERCKNEINQHEKSLIGYTLDPGTNPPG